MKRMFFGIEVHAKWPESFPPGRILDENCRHLTLAFLGDRDISELKNPPLLNYKVGLVGVLDKCLFLPKRHPHVVCYDVKWLEKAEKFEEYRSTLNNWLKFEEKEKFLPHVTICRAPKAIKEWKDTFSPMPFMATHLHLFESLGNSKYQPLWTCKVKPPFEELEHTADIAFRIHGETLHELHRHAHVAMAFKFPLLLNYVTWQEPKSLDDIIFDLNETITKIDMDIGCPFKAVSYHGDIIKEPDGTLKWEMIIDV